MKKALKQGELVDMKRSVKTILALVLCLVFVFGTAAEAATVRIPYGVKTIEAEAFYGDTSLDVVYIPSDTQTIGDRAFAYSSARIVVFYGDVTSFGKDIFKGCNLEAIECGSWNTNTRRWLKANGYEDILTEWYVKATPYASEAKIKVEWTTGPNATSYTLFYSTGIKGNPLATVNSVNVGNVGEYVLTGLESYTTYHIWVVAYRDSHEIDESDDIEVVTKGNGPNPQFDDPVIPGDGPIIRDVYSTDGGKTLTIEFDKYEGAAWYEVIFRNTEADEYETVSVNAAESTNNGLVSADAWIETFLQDNTTYRITVKAYDGDLQLLSFESDDPVYYTTDFSTPILYPTSITLNREEKEMRVGDSFDLTATLEPSDLSAEASEIIWGSYNEGVASVDDGEVYANNIGSAVVYARTLNGLYAYCQVTVLPDPYITGGFQDNEARKIVKFGHQDQLNYHVEVDYAKIENIKLVQRNGNKSTTIFTNSHNGQTVADGYFTISAEPGGEFRSLGSVYTLDLVVTLKDGTIQTLDTATVEIGYGMPEPVGNVDAYYSSGKIYVTWDNNGDARRFKVIFYTPDGQSVNYVDVNDENAEEAIIPASQISQYQTYLIYVVAYPTNGVEFYSRSDTVRVTTVNSSTPAVTARFVGNQKVYAPGETIKIEITYNNVDKVHYHNGDVNYNPNAGNTNNSSGDITFSSDQSGIQVVELKAQNTSGWYKVEINAKNKSGVQASNFYDYTTYTGVDCLGLDYYVDAVGLDAPTWRTTRSMASVAQLIWTYVQRAVGYRIWISTTNNINDAEARDVGDINEYTLTGLVTGKNYYVWVQAIDSNGGGGISSSKKVNQSATTPSVSATITKPNIAPGDSIPIRITYNNVIMVQYQNGTGDHGVIWADGVLQEDADFNVSGTDDVSLLAETIPGTYSMTIKVKDTAGNLVTIQKEYTVTGDAPSPYVSLSICPESRDTVMQGVNENNVIWLTADYTNATKLVYTLHNQNNANSPTYTFTTAGYYKSDPSMPSFTISDLTFASYSQSEGMSFIPSDRLEPGTYTLRVTATNDYGGEPAKDYVQITVKGFDPSNAYAVREDIKTEAYRWLSTTWDANGTPIYARYIIHYKDYNHFVNKIKLDAPEEVPQPYVTTSVQVHGLPYTGYSDTDYYRCELDTFVNGLTKNRSKYIQATGHYSYQGGRQSNQYGTECVGFCLQVWHNAAALYDEYVSYKSTIGGSTGGSSFESAKAIRHGITSSTDLMKVAVGDIIYNDGHCLLVVDNKTSISKIQVIEQTANSLDWDDGGDFVPCECESCSDGLTKSLGTRLKTYEYSKIVGSYYAFARLKLSMTEDWDTMSADGWTVKTTNN